MSNCGVCIYLGNYRLRPFCAGWVIERHIPSHTTTKAGRAYSAGEIAKDRWKAECYPHNLEHGIRLLNERAVKDEPSEAFGKQEIELLLRDICERLQEAAKTAAKKST